MAREVIVSTWCDVHLEAGSRVNAQEISLAVNGAAPLMLALCDECALVVWQPLAVLLDRIGQATTTVAAPPPSADRLPPKGHADCPLPGCGQTLPHKRLSDHVRRAHDMGLKQARAAYGGLALTPREITAARAAAERAEPGPDCPACDFQARNRTGLAAHVRVKHPTMDTAQRDALFVAPWGHTEPPADRVAS